MLATLQILYPCEEAKIKMEKVRGGERQVLFSSLVCFGDPNVTGTSLILYINIALTCNTLLPFITKVLAYRSRN